MLEPTPFQPATQTEHNGILSERERINIVSLFMDTVDQLMRVATNKNLMHVDQAELLDLRNITSSVKRITARTTEAGQISLLTHCVVGGKIDPLPIEE